MLNGLHHFIARLRLWRRKQELRWWYNQCHRAAYKICLIGFDHGPRIQQHLDEAKDELYRAAGEFDRERKIIEADQTFGKHRAFARRLPIVK